MDGWMDGWMDGLHGLHIFRDFKAIWEVIPTDWLTSERVTISSDKKPVEIPGRD